MIEGQERTGQLFMKHFLFCFGRHIDEFVQDGSHDPAVVEESAVHTADEDIGFLLVP